MDDPKENNVMKFLILAISALVVLFGITYSLLLDRVNKQEVNAARDIAVLREEIKATKADAKDAITAASIASKDAVQATALALKDSVQATAQASKEAVAASASALKDSVQATSVSSKAATDAIASALSDKIDILSKRIEKIEDKDAMREKAQ